MKRLRRWGLLAVGMVAALVVGCSTPESLKAQPLDSGSQGVSALVTAPPNDPDGIGRLRPEVRAMLDGIRKLMGEPSLLLNRDQTLKLFDTRVTRTRKIVRDDASVVTEDRFIATAGLFANPAWQGGFNFRQLDPCTSACKSFQVQVEVFVKEEKDCVSSRAVHAYLQLPLELQPRAGGYTSRPDIHGNGAFILRSQARNKLPDLEIAFSNGCFGFLSLSHVFHYTEYSDANVLYK
jgi:hypothetical protein